MEIDARDDLTQQHGCVHGGVVSYLIDNAITFAAGTELGAALMTVGFTVDYLRPAAGSGSKPMLPSSEPGRVWLSWGATST